MVGVAEERHGGVDILVNNAGGWGPTANYLYASALQWGSALDLNLRRARCSPRSSCSEPMRRRGGGAVVTRPRRAGSALAPYEAPEYCVAKAGLIRFTARMAYAREDTGVRVNCVVPDWIATDRALGEFAAMTPEQRAAEAPLRRPGRPGDAIVELVRDESLAGRVMLLPRGEPRAVGRRLARRVVAIRVSRRSGAPIWRDARTVQDYAGNRHLSDSSRDRAAERPGSQRARSCSRRRARLVGRARRPGGQAAPRPSGRAMPRSAPELLTEEGQLVAALLAAGDGALLSHGLRPGAGASSPPLPR